jgi:pimeloyl-ACP methyl ester carboxylesterase
MDINYPLNLIVNNQLISYAEDGDRSRPVIVLLHGWGADIQSFAQIASKLKSDFRVIRIDFPGFGGSELPPVGWHVIDYATMLQSFLSKLDITHIHGIIGHSFGGRVAIKAIGAGLIEPSRLILMGSAGVKHSNTLRNHAFNAVAKLGKTVTALPGLSVVRTRLRRQLYNAAGSTDYLDAGPMRQVFLSTIGEDLQADARTISVKTLLIWGENDSDTPVSDGQLLAAATPHSKLEVIPNAGHFVYLDAPYVVLALVKKFLA